MTTTARCRRSLRDKDGNWQQFMTAHYRRK